MTYRSEGCRTAPSDGAAMAGDGMSARHVALALAGLFALAACSSSESDAAETRPPRTTVSPATTTTRPDTTEIEAAVASCDLGTVGDAGRSMTFTAPSAEAARCVLDGVGLPSDLFDQLVRATVEQGSRDSSWSHNGLDYLISWYTDGELLHVVVTDATPP